MNSFFFLIFLYICHQSQSTVNKTSVVYQKYPTPCDVNAAQQCEYELLMCKLFTGPADDAATLCRCGTTFYGECLRLAGCETHEEVGALTKHEIYMKTCIDLIINYDCPSSMMCAINCASDTQIDLSTTKIIPFNNYGAYYLRIRICENKVQSQQLSRYSFVNTVPCKKLEDFNICSRWIPPQTFVPVALPINTTYVEIDSCQFDDSGKPYCLTSNPPPAKLYGNKFIFPTSYNVAQTNVSVCETNENCLGSYCDFHFYPPVCAPKTLQQVMKTGRFYLSNPFGA